jgi:hypothetical protein
MMTPDRKILSGSHARWSGIRDSLTSTNNPG